MSKAIQSGYNRVLAFIVITGAFLLLYILATHAIPASSKDAFNILAGITYNGTVGRVMRAFFPEKHEAQNSNEQNIQQ